MRTIQSSNINLTSDESSELISRLATELGIPDEQLTLIFASSPSFLGAETLLFRAVSSVHGERSPAYLGYYSRITDAVEVVALDRTDISGVNSFLDYVAQNPDQLILDKTTVLDYVRFFIGMWGSIRGETPIEEISDILWYTELLHEERNAIAAALERNPLEITDDDFENRFEINACVLQDDKLKRITFFVEKESTAQSLGDSPKKLAKGDLNLLDENEQVLLTCLPDNFMIAPDHWAAVFTEDATPETNCDWAFITHRDEKYAILQDIFRCLEPAPAPEHCTLRRKYLPFYRQFLYEIGCPYNGSHRVVPVIWSPGNARPINYDIESNVQLNRLFSEALHATLGNEIVMQEYVRFINKCSMDEDGPSLLVEDRQHARFTEVDLDEIGTLKGVSTDEAWGRIKPMDISRENEGWMIEFCTWEGYDIIHHRMHIMANGDIKLDVDHVELVMSFPVPEEITPSTHEHLTLSLNTMSLRQQQQSREMLIPCVAESLAEEITAAPDKGKLTIANRVVFGCLDLEGTSISVGLIFENCRFRGPANLSSIACPSNLSIKACVFENGLNIAHANIKHALSISDSVLLSGKGMAWSLVMEHLTAQSVEITRTNCQRGIYANGLNIGGNVEITDYTAYGPFSMRESAIAGVLTLASKTRPFYVRGWGDIEYIKVRSAFLQGITVDGALTMDYGSVDQYLAFEAAESEHNTWPVRIGHWDGCETPLGLSLYGTVIKHNFLAFRGIDIAGELKADYVRVGTGIFVETPAVTGIGNHIRGALSLNGSIAPQVLGIRGCRIDGDLNASGIHTGEVRIREAYLNGDNDDTARNEPVEVGGSIIFSEAEVEGDALFAGITTNTVNPDTPHSLILRRTAIKGNLTLYASAQRMRSTEKHVKDELINRASRAVLPRGINLRKANIEGDLDLSHIDATEGEVDLKDAVIGRDIRIKPRASDHPATIAALNMEGMRCSGDANLSGLVLLSKSSRSDISGQGSIRARGIIIDGALNVYKDGASAIIPGKLDLNSGKLGELSISFRYFKYPCDNKSLETRGILLNKATIEKLSVTVDEGYPCPIDLRFADIKWWEFHRSGDTTCENADDYIALLDKDPNKQQHTWRAVEDSLNERGYEEAADSVHKAMRHWVRETEKQEARESNSIFKKAWIYFRLLPRMPLDFFTEYGTTTWRLVIAMVLWFTLSIHLFSISNNIAPSEEGLAVTNTALTNSDHPAGWSNWDGFWVAIRFHVPVILFTARDEWEPTNGNKLVIYQGTAGNPVHFPFGDPEEYANLVIIFHWLAWPIILITASRKLFRRPGNN